MQAENEQDELLNENEALFGGLSAEPGSEIATGISTVQKGEEQTVDDISEGSDEGWDTDLEIESKINKQTATFTS